MPTPRAHPLKKPRVGHPAVQERPLQRLGEEGEEGLGKEGCGGVGEAEESFGLGAGVLLAAIVGDVHLEGEPVAGILGGVGVAGGAVAGGDGGSVDVVGGGKGEGVFGDFVVVESEFFVGGEPGVEDERGDGAMIAVGIDRPLGEDQVGGFGGEEAGKFVVVRGIDDGAAIVLGGEDGARFQDGAGFFGFGGTDARAVFEVVCAAEAFAAVQVEENDFVAQVGVAGSGAAAATLGIAGMSAGDDDFEFARRRGIGGGGREEICCRGQCGDGGNKFCRLKDELAARESHGGTSMGKKIARERREG